LTPSVVLRSQTLFATLDIFRGVRIAKAWQALGDTLKTRGFWQNRSIAAASAAVVPLLVVGFTSSAEAQIFCPTTAGGGNTGIALSGGFCTNGNTGALSTAALSSQSLSEVTQTTTQQSTTSTLEAVEKRRNEEAQRCPEGFERVGGSCRRIPQRTTSTSSATSAGSSQSTITEPAPVARRTGANTSGEPARRRANISQTEPARRRATTAPALYKAPPMVYESVRYAVWGQGYGDYERRSGTGVASSGPLIGGGGGNAAIPVDLGRNTTTWGFTGGLDATYRNLGWAGDILVAGLLTGYMSSTTTYSATSLKAQIDGPSAGAFATYLNGPFSADLLTRIDFLRVNETFSDLLNFNLGANAGTVPFSGSGSTNVNDYVVAGNGNYRLVTTPTWWLEPTVGFRFIYSDFADGSAAVLGLKDGHDWRVQGGLRVGTDFFWSTVRVTPTVTGLAYDDVQVTGGVITGGAFPVAAIVPSDQGKVRGQGIFNVNFDYGNGVSAFVLGDVRGGSDLLAAGGRAGIRYQW
jgi:Autotransporter beta-domain